MATWKLPASSPWCGTTPPFDDPTDPDTYEDAPAAGDVLDYNQYYNNQLIEILSSNKYGNNGHFNEVWMDGAKGSGSSANYLAWYEPDGKIVSGTASAGHNDSGVTRTATFTVTISKAGTGTWVFAPTDADSPQIDKFDITLTQIAS